MKAWQHGYELDELKRIEGQFSEYNKVVLSPFAQMKKNKVAQLLHEDKLDEWSLPNNTEAWIPTNVAKSAVHVRAYGDVDLGIRQKGERMIDNPVGNKDILLDIIGKYEENLWMTINSEYKLGNQIAKKLKFEKVGIKVNSFSDIINVYVKKNTDIPMKVFLISPLEALNIGKVTEVPMDAVEGIKEKVKDLDFANHYSNYNKSKSWSALSLRGFSPAPTFIEKPSEMNDKWQKDNANADFKIQDTPLMKVFEPHISKILAMIPTQKERIRLMKLEPNGGELERHTDQTDKDIGITDGKIIRLHVPIITSKNVAFSSWNWEGKEDVRNMHVGEMYYLDIRKPHKAVNTGTEPRIHLVIDAIANQELRDMIL